MIGDEDVVGDHAVAARRAHAGDDSAFSESVQIRDAIAPLLIEEVLHRYTLADQHALRERLDGVRCALDSGKVSDFIWACWEIHAYVAEIGKAGLLNTLYLSIMDVGTSYVRAKLETTDRENMDLEPLAQVMEDLVDALARRDVDAAVDALRRTVPTVTFRRQPHANC